jgi:hypothetical protein
MVMMTRMDPRGIHGALKIKVRLRFCQAPEQFSGIEGLGIFACFLFSLRQHLIVCWSFQPLLSPRDVFGKTHAFRSRGIKMSKELHGPDPMYEKRVSQLAYEYWIQRGRPNGTPDVDWRRAEETVERDIHPLSGAVGFAKSGVFSLESEC